MNKINTPKINEWIQKNYILSKTKTKNILKLKVDFRYSGLCLEDLTSVDDLKYTVIQAFKILDPNQYPIIEIDGNLYHACEYTFNKPSKTVRVRLSTII